MALFMMVFVGGTPLGAPLIGWVTDVYGPRLGFALGGLVSMAAATAIGLVLARLGGLRVSLGWHHGRPRIRFVPRAQSEEQLATAA